MARRPPGRVGELLEEWELDRTAQRCTGSARSSCRCARPTARRRCSRSVSRTRSPSTSTWPSSTGTARRGAAAAGRPAPRALLLERLHPEDLAESGTSRRARSSPASTRVLHVPALPQLRTRHVVRRELARRPAEHCRATRRSRGGWSSRRSRSAATSSPTRRAPGGSCTATCTTRTCWPADREPWLVIDPKPMSGDPHYELAPMLWNRWDELAGDVRDGVRRRFHTLVDTAGLDEDRARDWVVVRMVLNAHWALEDAEPDDRPLSTEERDWITAASRSPRPCRTAQHGRIGVRDRFSPAPSTSAGPRPRLGRDRPHLDREAAGDRPGRGAHAGPRGRPGLRHRAPRRASTRRSTPSPARTSTAWAEWLGQPIRDGQFGENLTTTGIDVNEAEVGERWRIGTAMLEVARVRIPCNDFKSWMGLSGFDDTAWVKRFTAEGRPGPLPAGRARGRARRPATRSEVVHRPGHGVTVSTMFARSPPTGPAAASCCASTGWSPRPGHGRRSTSRAPDPGQDSRQTGVRLPGRNLLI